MRVALRHENAHPLPLQVMRTSQGKFLVNTNNGVDANLVQDDVSPPNSPVNFPTEPNGISNGDPRSPRILGDRFLLLERIETSTLFKCVDIQTGENLVAKAIVAGDKGAEAMLQAHMRLARSGAASEVAGMVDAGRTRYLLIEGHHGDLHSYVRARRRIREPEARRLFKQVAEAVQTCHQSGIVLRDLKLRKFVFTDEQKTRLCLESLEDAVLIDENNDKLTDRRGCPAYVAPEVLRSGLYYSGKGADVWSLGVLLYTMLVGRYPFNDAEHSSLFIKITRGAFALPENLSPRARCLIKAMLRRTPEERPEIEDVLGHPWLTRPTRYQMPPSNAGNAVVGGMAQVSARPNRDQTVPDLGLRMIED